MRARSAGEASAAASSVALRVAGFFYPLPSQAQIARRPRRRPQIAAALAARPQLAAALAPWFGVGELVAPGPAVATHHIASSPPPVHPTTPYSSHLIRLPPPRAEAEMSR